MNRLVQLEYSRSCPLCKGNLLHAADGEIICSRCGAVLGYSSNNDDSIIRYRRIEPKLYNAVHVGTEAYLSRSTRFYSSSKDEQLLSLFSNLCERLSLPWHITFECWSYYSKLLKCVKMGSAELAMLVVYTVCNRYSLRKSQEEIRDAVELVYARRYLPTIQRILLNFANEVYRCKDANMVEMYMHFLDIDERARRRARKILSIINNVNLKRVMNLAC
ncbi:hypothetical protein HRbin04_00170 [archaeon HR04]|nr:hypothetical protein HRbin04_00170 [archaeon HR04]